MLFFALVSVNDSLPASTNLHTHGLHLSGEGVSDNVFLNIDPGKSQEYTYSIPCDHAGGSYFYHPHKHGSVNVQVAGGAMTGCLASYTDSKRS